MAHEHDGALIASLLSEGASPRGLFEAVLGCVADGVTIVDRAGNAYMNPAARTILGLGPEASGDFRGEGCELYSLHDFTPFAAEEYPLARALRGEDVREAQLFWKSPGMPDGALICLSAMSLRDGDGHVVGGMAVFHDVGARKRAEEELRAANAKLNAWVAELERRAQGSLLMNEMADLLQSCRTTREFYTVVTRFAARIFDGQPGAVFVVNASRSAIERVAEWGPETTGERIFAPESCWALRRGRLHRAGGTALGLDCTHGHQDATNGYTCIPMMGQGEALGVLHVRQPSMVPIEGELGEIVEEARLRTIISVAEHIALALANLKLRETLQMQAIREPLTGLFNRRYMEESFAREIGRAERNKTSVACVMIDFDHFKRFNDTFGHSAADYALRETANIIKASVNADDIACRFGGEEFVVILPDTSIEEATKRAEKIRLAISEQQLRYHGTPLAKITASFGVAAYPTHGSGAEDLLRAADEGLYLAKGQGRDRVAVKEIPARMNGHKNGASNGASKQLPTNEESV